MDALKKAEQGKHPAEPAATAPAPEPSADDGGSFPSLDLAAPLPEPPAAPPAPSLAQEPPSAQAAPMELSLEPAPRPAPPKAGFAAAAPPAPPESQPEPPKPEPKSEAAASPPPRPSPTPSRPTATPQQSARNVFAAKTGAAGKRAALGPSRLIVIGVAAAGLLSALGGGIYLYRELNPQPLVIPLNPAPLPRPAPQTPSPQPLPAEPANEAPPAAESPAAESPAAPAPPPHRKPASAEPAPPQDTAAIRIQHGASTGQVNPALSRAYQALLAGDLNQAQEEYRKILRGDRNSRDALLGMAVIHERRGDAETAAGIYSRLLELDPNDGTAQARLTALGVSTDPVRGESRLKTLLAQQPDSDTLRFALGNLYAAQARWPEAQEAYFHAFQKQPGNPDYLYNLAVSLDHLGQNKLALDYYRRALAAAGRPHAFAADAVKTRIGALEQAVGQDAAAPRQ
jgi:Tfp pilus assembly protein PilF